MSQTIGTGLDETTQGTIRQLTQTLADKKCNVKKLGRAGGGGGGGGAMHTKI